MSSRRACWTILLGTVLAIPGPLASQERGGILLSPWTDLRWRGEYNNARREAHEKNLPLLIDFGTTDCFWCRKLDETTFRDPRIVALLNERFVPLKVDAEREVNLANHLRIESYPTLVLANSEGKILAYLKGYQDAETFHGVLQTLLVNLQPPEWMQKEYRSALKSLQLGDYAAAIPSLRLMVQEGKGHSLQQQAQKHLDGLEAKALERIAQARDFEDKGRASDATQVLEDTLRTFTGLEATRQARALLARLKDAPVEQTLAQRGRRAAELLVQARDFHRQRDLVPCLDRCSTLLREYVDLPEGQEANAIMNDIKNQPLLLQQAADSLSERLGDMYLALAETHLNKGQPQRAEYYLQRVILACPGSRQAESAQVRLTQLQSVRPRSTSSLTSARPPE